MANHVLREIRTAPEPIDRSQHFSGMREGFPPTTRTLGSVTTHPGVVMMIDVLEPTGREGREWLASFISIADSRTFQTGCTAVHGTPRGTTLRFRRTDSLQTLLDDHIGLVHGLDRRATGRHNLNEHLRRPVT